MSTLKLFDFQKNGVEFLLGSARRLLSDDVGLGKTIQVLAAIETVARVKNKTNILVVCPAALTLMWGEAVREWFGDRCSVVQMKDVGSSPVRLDAVGVRVVVCSYNFLQKATNVERLRRCRWSVIVADEAHRCKTFTSKTCQGMVRLVDGHQGYLWMLTATPATRSGSDYYIYARLLGGETKEYVGFCHEYCEMRTNRFTRKPEFVGLKETKRPLLKEYFKSFTLRRKKSEVLKELPERLYTHIPVEVSAELVAESAGVNPEQLAQAMESGRPLPGNMAKLMRAIGLAKVEAAVEYITDLAQPVVVFAVHTDVVEQVMTRCSQAGLSCGRITGADSVEDKQSVVDAFQRGELNVVVCNIRAAGVGITLTRASHLLFVELSFSPADMEQAEGRVDRIGQKAGCINIIKLVGEKTLDRACLGTVRYKNKFMKEVMGDVNETK